MLQKWILEHFYDFEDDDVLLRSLLTFIDTQLQHEPAVANRLRLAVQQQCADSVLYALGPQVSLEVIVEAIQVRALLLSLFVCESDDRALYCAVFLFSFLACAETEQRAGAGPQHAQAAAKAHVERQCAGRLVDVPQPPARAVRRDSRVRTDARAGPAGGSGRRCVRRRP